MRRRFQTGHIFQRGKRRKVWVARYVEPRLEEGKLKHTLRSRVIGPAAEMTKSAARTVLEGWLRPLNEGQFVPMEVASFDQFYEKWERDLLPSYRASTRGFYQRTAQRWVRPYFEGWSMAQIRPDSVQQFINLFGGRYSRSVLKHVRATLGCLFATAVKWHFLKENPAEGMRLPEGKAVRRAVVLKPEDIARLLERLEEPYRAMVAIAAATGMRESEVLALQWDDFDPGARTVKVGRSVYRGVVGAVKTKESAREIPYCPAMADELVRLATSVRNGGEFLFRTAHGHLFAAQQVTAKVFRPLSRELGLPDFTWRSFRRSAESAMHNAGVPLKVQQQMLGHSNPNTTLLYAEADQQGKRDAVDELGRIIFPKFSQIAASIASKAVN